MAQQNRIMIAKPGNALRLQLSLRKVQFAQQADPKNGTDRFPHGMHGFFVKCVKDGGAAGGGGSTCSWTFTLKDLRTDATLSTAQPQRKGWTPNVEYQVPNALGVEGLAFRDLTGNIVLWEAAVQQVTEECP